MSAAARVRLSQVDPQSGPIQAEGRVGFFHFNLKWVHASPGRISGLFVSNYINRIGMPSGGALTPDCGAADEVEFSAARASAYITRTTGDREMGELGAHVLLTRGLPVTTGAALARLLDSRERKKDRNYRCYGGKLPRVATHAIASYRHGVTSEQAGTMLHDFAHALSERLLVPVEGQVHNKKGKPDHAHLLIGTRIVVSGRLGRKQRQLDAVSEKADGRSIDVGEHHVGKTIEWMRGEWAARMRAISGDMSIDHRSYKRRGLAVTPVVQVPRADIEYERRRGKATWRERRRRELAARHTSTPLDYIDSNGQDRDRESQSKPLAVQADARSVEQRARTLLDMVTFHTRPGTVVGDPLAGLLGLDVPEEPLLPVMRERVGESPRREHQTGNVASTERGAAALAGALTTSVTGDKAAGGDASGARADMLDSARSVVVPDELSRKGKSHLHRGGPVLKPQQAFDAGAVSTQPGEMAAARGAHGHGKNEEAEDEPRDLHHATAMFKALRRARRLSAVRVEALAAAAGLERVAFEAAAAAVIDGATNFSALPPHLQTIWTQWSDQDNEARRARRSVVSTSATMHSITAAENDGSAPDRGTSGRTVTDELGRDSDAIGAAASATGPRSDEQPNSDLVQSISQTSGPTLSQTGPAEEQRTAHAGPDAAMNPDVLALALTDALASDVRASARRRGAPPPSIATLERGIAIRLRATGRDRAEIAAVLAVAARRIAQDGHEHTTPSLAHAFSDKTAEWLEAQPLFVGRIRVLEARTEAQLFHRLRRQALRELTADLDAVWTQRRMRAEEAARRHARRLDLLHALSWRIRRVRRRDDLVTAILALLVELAVLRPLIARQRRLAVAERNAINEAAAIASAALGEKRAQWRKYVGARGAQAATVAPSINSAAADDKKSDVVTAAADASAEATRPTPGASTSTFRAAPAGEAAPGEAASGQDRLHRATRQPPLSGAADDRGDVRKPDAVKLRPSYRVLEEGEAETRIRIPVPPRHARRGSTQSRIDQDGWRDNIRNAEAGQVDSQERTDQGENGSPAFVQPAQTASAATADILGRPPNGGKTGGAALAVARRAGLALRRSIGGKEVGVTSPLGLPATPVANETASHAEIQDRAAAASDRRLSEGRSIPAQIGDALPHAALTDASLAARAGRHATSPHPESHVHDAGPADVRLGIRLPMPERGRSGQRASGADTIRSNGLAQAGGTALGSEASGIEQDVKPKVPMVDEIGPPTKTGAAPPRGNMPAGQRREGSDRVGKMPVVHTPVTIKESARQAPSDATLSNSPALSTARPRQADHETVDSTGSAGMSMSQTNRRIAKGPVITPKRPGGRDGID